MYLCRKTYRERITAREEKETVKMLEERRRKEGNKEEIKSSEINY
jgi:hypothetical protein